MEFSYSQTENFEMEKLSSDTGYFKKPVEINRGSGYLDLSPVGSPLQLLLLLFRLPTYIDYRNQGYGVSSPETQN
jgi:hypothetical protein